MPERKFESNEERKPVIALRRSPRFLRGSQIAVENPETPKPAARKPRAAVSFSTPLGYSITKTQKNGDGISQNEGGKGTKLKTLAKSSEGSRKSARLGRGANFSCPDLQKQNVIERRVTRSSIGGGRFVKSLEIGCDGISGKGDGEVKSSEEYGKGSRRSARLQARAKLSKSEEVLSLQKQCVIEKRATRSSIRRNRAVFYEVIKSDSEEDPSERVRILSKEGKAKVGGDFCKKNIGNIEKRATCSTTRRKTNQLVEKASNVSTENQEVKPKGDNEPSKPSTIKRDVKDCGIMMRSGDENCRRKTHIGEKRKKYQVEEECETVQGWTKEQDLALQKAYFTAKPTPQFWKEVARMVPGKSAEECFDRIHADHSTPNQPQTRSRAKKKEHSPISFSASKLLSPAEMKSKKLQSRRRRTFLAQKTVRQLLRKQHNEDKGYEADLFAVLEPTIDPSPLSFQEGTVFASPAPKQGSGILKTCRQMSSSAQRKHLSRLNNSKKAAFVSPPVLKQIKNKALHEKYIDQLHCRDAKRMAESLRSAKNSKDQIDEKVSHLNPNLIKVAKDALVCNAQDAISQFRRLQSQTKDSIDDDDNTSCSDEDEDEFANI